eukprot:TRINITY_DN102808_c0_g1_i1.p2 TRINITY_DN102808_c0_g1~~TRINITY_DN102808_c0_g1_i1.p2  ORF type:complete len:109 (-),score=27.89 TRINITY_DN102808_c0_g1_i1:115-441(-)
MAARRVLLPTLLLALAAAFVLSQTAFVGGNVQQTGVQTRSLRQTSHTARAALPAEMASVVDASSVTTALQVSGAAYIFNILILVFPCAFLVFLFLYSERTLSDEEAAA